MYEFIYMLSYIIYKHTYIHKVTHNIQTYMHTYIELQQYVFYTVYQRISEYIRESNIEKQQQKRSRCSLVGSVLSRVKTPGQTSKRKYENISSKSSSQQSSGTNSENK